MKNTCKNCGKYLDDIDDFGYCKKCSAKLFKKNKHTTEEQRKIKTVRKRIITIVLLIIVVVLFIIFKDNILSFTYKVLTSSDSIGDIIPDEITSAITPVEDQVLTAENYETLTSKFSEKYKDKDEFYYFSYAILRNALADGIKSALSNQDNSIEDAVMYKNIYGKTINELIEEGKELMKNNNISVEEYKQSLNNLNQDIEDFNQSINELNNSEN